MQQQLFKFYSQLGQSKFNNNERAAVLVMFICFFTVLLLFSALALDSGLLYRAKLESQKAADAATLGATGMMLFDNTLLNNGASAGGMIAAQAKEVIEKNLELAGFDLADALEAGVVSNADYRYAVLGDNPPSLTATAKAKPEFFLLDRIPQLLGQSGESLTTISQSEAKIIREDANIVLLLDTSHSMECPATGPCLCKEGSLNNGNCVYNESKIKKLKEAVTAFVSMFDPNRDRIALIAFGSAAEVLLPSTDPDTEPNPRGFNSANLLALIAPNNQDALRPAGNTNICDAMYRGYEDMADVINSGEKVHYVLFSDGAPTAGRFLWVNDAVDPTKLPLPTTPSPIGTYDYQQYTVTWRTIDGVAYHAPSQLVEWNTLSRGYTVQVGSGGSLNTAGQAIPACSVLSDKLSLPPDAGSLTTTQLNEALADEMIANYPSVVKNCLKDVLSEDSTNRYDGLGDLRYHMPNPPIRNRGAAYVFGTRDWDSDLNTSVPGIDITTEYGTRWAMPFYDCAVQTSDFLREENGMVWVIGLGEPACIGTDPYQDILDHLSRKDILLTRVAHDYSRAKRDPIPDDAWNNFIETGRCGVTSQSVRPIADHPEFTNGNTEGMGANSKKSGRYRSTTDAGQLTNIFRQMAIEIKLRLIR